ncbi:hypothetical protein HHI36_023487 [Cryptolaemus montrouzieri]|uniref:Ribosomal protein L7Ae/L30e/S12e/Gadd45 domain-containing protein n=1 Tax=Cryptolaemus montrouzieri TaxID=559131 RepID=A0ABD2PHF5_9CUCU
MANGLVQLDFVQTRDVLRFPDPVLFQQEIRYSNKLAKPIGNQTVTNKCYALLNRVIFFPSSVYIGNHVVHNMLKSTIYMPCLVMLATDTFIDKVLGNIPKLCIKSGIPYIYIPRKDFIGQALNLNINVTAVLISYCNDPGYQSEFQSAYEGISSQCFGENSTFKDDLAKPVTAIYKGNHLVPTFPPSATDTLNSISHNKGNRKKN